MASKRATIPGRLQFRSGAGELSPSDHVPLRLPPPRPSATDTVAPTIRAAHERRYGGQMRIANVDGRAKLIEEGRLSTCTPPATAGTGPRSPAVYDDWAAFRSWAATAPHDPRHEPFDPAEGHLRATVAEPAPGVHAVALNATGPTRPSHTGVAAPDSPLIFAKYVSAFTGAVTEVELPEGHVDWECELVAVIFPPGPEAPTPRGRLVLRGRADRRARLVRAHPAAQWPGAPVRAGQVPPGLRAHRTGPGHARRATPGSRTTWPSACQVNGQTMQGTPAPPS